MNITPRIESIKELHVTISISDLVSDVVDLKDHDFVVLHVESLERSKTVRIPTIQIDRWL